MDFSKIEKKWKDRWVEEKIFAANDDSSKEKMYVLVEFPYPSGEGLHIGHTFTMTAGDVYARFKRMMGKEVLFPMGFDAFGLPAENYAIKVKKNPRLVTKENCANYKKQMIELGMSFDWDRTINTTDSKYYKWTQWIFVQLFKKGLAYKEEKEINWCPSCKIGLANEEVLNGKCERCGAEASKKKLNQWMLKITEYADRLIDDLDKTEYQEHIKIAQTNWIGRTSGINIDYPFKGEEDKFVSCYSTRPDTNYGATFIVISPENPLAIEISDDEHKKEVENYVDESKKKSERDRIADYTARTGVFTGRYCINRLTGKEMPVYVADFVVATSGTGAVVGVPAHDERDFDFAKKYDLEIIPVIKPDGQWNFNEKPYTEVDKGTVFNSEIINGLKPKEAVKKIIKYLVEKGWGTETNNYHLRDWIFSRQHYWGEPIPMVNCKKCGWVPVDEKDLPVELPDVEHYEPTDTGESPLAAMENWLNVKCPKCGGDAKRETDTMPNWAGSCWYYVRYLDSHNDSEIASKDKLKTWMSVDLYFGGSEHTYLHLLYSRFWYKFLFDMGVVPDSEPYIRRVEHGVILGSDGKRMSKSRGNTINPDEVCKKYGVDAIRTYLMFMGPFANIMAWNESAVVGVKRFLERLFTFVSAGKDNLSEKSSKDVEIAVNKAIKKVTEGIDSFSFNTGVSSMMEMLNSIENAEEISKSTLEKIIKIISPYSPYVAEELWEMIGNEFSVSTSEWPDFDENLLVEDTINLPVQINGKVRSEVSVSKDDSEDVVKEKVMEDEKIKKNIGDQKVKKFIYIPGRIANIVV
ncbi:MAG: leucine--tRNA ligase [bacterium]